MSIFLAVYYDFMSCPQNRGFKVSKKFYLNSTINSVSDLRLIWAMSMN